MARSIPRLWVIYDHPLDFPDSFVVRLFRDGRPTQAHVLAESLDGARQMIPKGLVRIKRDEADDPCIVETWV